MLINHEQATERLIWDQAYSQQQLCELGKWHGSKKIFYMSIKKIQQTSILIENIEKKLWNPEDKNKAWEWKW